MTTTDQTRPNKATRAVDVAKWDMETDVAIVGFGGAGACAAIEASEAGASAMIFEAASAAGGSTALSGGEMYLGGSGGTPIQRAFGFEDSTENLITYLTMSAGPQADHDKIRTYAEGAVEHFHWIRNKGVPFKESFINERLIEPITDDCLMFCGNEKAWPEVTKAKPLPRGHAVQQEGFGAGATIIQRLEEYLATRDNVQVHFETRALSLVADDNGAVLGLIIRKDGKELAVRARKGVILCAGGFVMNEEMVRMHSPMLTLARQASDPIGNPNDTGSGILMGQSVGGEAINMHEGFISLPFYPPSTTTFGIMVNDKGQRFINEDAYHGRVGYHALHQVGDRVYLVLDVESYGNYEEMNFLQASVAGTGETPEELEAELGLPEGSLSHTLNFYNAHAAKGEDPLFHKQPEWLRPLEAPFVALDVTPGRGAYYPSFTLGGLNTLPTGEVKRADGTLVPGLYAAGRTACGIPRRAVGYSSGMSVGDATFFGRKAGRAAATRNA